MRHVIHDPALALHAARFSKSPASLGSEAWYTDPSVLESAAKALVHPTASFAYQTTELGRQARDLGRTAAAIARVVSSDPRAWLAALVAPLGWYGLAACEPDNATADKATMLTRKLARRWQLPGWLADVLIHLGSDEQMIDEVAEEPGLVRLVRRCVASAERRTKPLGIVPESIEETFDGVVIETDWPKGNTPATNHVLLPHLLKTAALGLRKSGMGLVPKLEAENELLRSALDRSYEQYRTTLHDAKLESLAELAAGAGHEINNPLAVISGHCQRLLNRESDPDKRSTLVTVVRQTMRIHGIVRGLMQFARPPKPHRDVISVPVIVEDVVGELSDLKSDKHVTISVQNDGDDSFVAADAAQVKTILHHVLRNAIEAAGTNGTVSVLLSTVNDRYQITVDDCGGGPNDEQREHLFDPFYSGREAGRGRGLGLSIAWRLAKINGGDVDFAPTSEHPSRFVITLPTELTRFEPHLYRQAG